jgi:hypothetical protein
MKINNVGSKTSWFEMCPILAYPVGFGINLSMASDVVIAAMIGDNATVSLQPQSGGANTRVPAHAALIQFIVLSAVTQ